MAPIGEYLSSLRKNRPRAHVSKSRYEIVAAECIRSLCSTFCSTPCSLSTITIDVLSKKNLGSKKGVLGEKKQAIRSIRQHLKNLDHTISVRHIQRMGKDRKGVAIVLVYFYFTKEKKRGGHVSLLVFDGYTRTQHFFNPWGFRDHWVSIEMARPENQLVKGFRVASVDTDAWLKPNDSLQWAYDKNSLRDGSGNCVLLCVLVAAMCLRFGRGDPKHMADELLRLDENKTRAGREKTLQELWSWMNEITLEARARKNGTVRSDTALRKIPSLLFPVPDAKDSPSCHIYLPDKKTYCLRKRCVNDIFCWQHRYFTRNSHAEGKNKMSCDTPLTKCRHYL
ncbi:FirrV-1-N2 [Feldmannia irregularis virus a]|uniref:FirrV-1-N2 n=1 Tax=Feldmannia irregularis virus a TaxID=231992 RepID=Q6XLT4_9PHYC|nr:FirrV-1-N2 [Feldmannia irregularis virus a]AAR26977.1 FirrV-1-N2 [Feldmannia irregularis virus a]